MSEIIRDALVLVVAATTLACAESGAMTGPTGAGRRMVVGTVIESAPTKSTTIAGAMITVVEGPDVGLVTTSDANGAFALLLQAGQIMLRVKADDHLERSVRVSLTQNRNLNVELDPIFRMVSVTRQNETIFLDDTCPDWYGFFPPSRGPNCRANYVFDVHHAGTLTAELSSRDRASSFHMAVFQSVDGNPSGLILPSEPHWRECCDGKLTVELGAHSQYVLQVNALPGQWPPSPSALFDLTVRHPN